jgi:hypothetical protein
VGDLGLQVSPRVVEGPLWTLSPRALRMWIFLATKAQHPPTHRMMADGQRVEIARGQWLTSARKLLRDLGRGGSLRTVTRDLEELKAAGVITVQTVKGRYRAGNRGVTEGVTGAAPQGNGVNVLATLVTVAGIELRQGGVTNRVTQVIRKRETKASPSLSWTRGEQEWERANRILVAEER